MTSIDKILCPIDFSEHSKVALEHAVSLALRLDADLVVAHVVEPAIYPVAFGTVPMGVSNIEEEAKQLAEESLQEAVDEAVASGVRCSSIVGSGTAALRVCEMVREHGFNLVVMATHGLTGLPHVLLGSTAERIVRDCPCAVFTVKTMKRAVGAS